MGNRRKPKRPDLAAESGPGVSLPKDEKVLVKTVPAVIHWGKFEDIERDDDEIVGECLIYEDGSHDIIVRKGDELSEDAKKVMGWYDQLKHLSIQRENNGWRNSQVTSGHLMSIKSLRSPRSSTR